MSFKNPGRLGLGWLDETEDVHLCLMLLDRLDMYKSRCPSPQQKGNSVIPAPRDDEASSTENSNDSRECMQELEFRNLPSLNGSPKAVALRVPEFCRTLRRTEESTSTFITVMWTNTSVLHTEYISLPESVELCGPCIVGCIDRSDVWNPEKLIQELFKRGYGDAIIRPDLDSKVVSPMIDMVENIRENRPHLAGLGSIPDGTSGTFSNQQDDDINSTAWSASNRVLHKNAQPKVANPGGEPVRSRRRTVYSVQFPHHDCNNTSNASLTATIHIHVDFPNDKIVNRWVKIPDEIQNLEPSTAIVDHWDANLGLEQLVLELIQYGCGSLDFFPTYSLHTLPNGARLVQYTLGSTCSSPTSHDYTSYYSSDYSSNQGYHSVGYSTNHYYRRIGQSPMSNFSSPMSFMTASRPGSFIIARSAFNSPAFALANGASPATRIETIREDEDPGPSIPGPLQQLRTDYYETLHQKNIIQPFDKELNWSGKGQHVTFLPHDTVPITLLSHLGSSMTATVDKVLCRRIALAKKTMRCSRKWGVADALREVYHLQNLRHFHIVQLVGSYLQGRNFSILMYPVADHHLGIFLEDTYGMKDSKINRSQYDRRTGFLASTLPCLTSAVAVIHKYTTKHMDIKPQNILVRKVGEGWRVYLADFGLSRSFALQDHSQTDGPTSRTPRYCAPEVYKYERRGRSADIFSLACVFLEILTVYSGHHPQDFADARRGGTDDESFHANLGRVHEWITMLSVTGYINHPGLMEHVVRMICEDPGQRPTASELQQFFSGPSDCAFSSGHCCENPPEPYEAYHPSDLEAERLGLTTGTSATS